MPAMQDLQQSLDAAADAFSKQSDVVRNLKSSQSCDSKELETAETLLKELKRTFYAAKKAVVDAAPKKVSPFNRVETEKILKSRFFLAPSFSIYGGIAGFYDYGPPGKLSCLSFVFFPFRLRSCTHRCF